MKIRKIWCAVLAGISFAAVGARADDPRHFLVQAIRGENSEIALGHLAVNRTSSAEVRAFANNLVNDHTRARDEMRRLADPSIRYDARMTDDAMAETNRLHLLVRRDFDQEFISFIIEDHRKEIALIRDEMRDNHGAISKVAAEQLPTVQKHLDIALSIQAHIGNRVTGSGFPGRPDHHDGHGNNHY